MNKTLTWRRYVSFEFRNGTCGSLFAIAMITSPRLDKLLFIACHKNIPELSTSLIPFFREDFQKIGAIEAFKNKPLLHYRACV